MSESYAQRFASRIRDDITQMGRHVIGVGGEPSFTYTIGHLFVGKPDLIMVGTSPQIATTIFNHIGSNLELSERLVHLNEGDLLDIGGQFPLKIHVCGARVRAEYTVQAGQFYRMESYKVLQLIVPDMTGRYPDDPECDQRFLAGAAID